MNKKQQAQLELLCAASFTKGVIGHPPKCLPDYFFVALEEASDRLGKAIDAAPGLEDLA